MLLDICIHPFFFFCCGERHLFSVFTSSVSVLKYSEFVLLLSLSDSYILIFCILTFFGYICFLIFIFFMLSAFLVLFLFSWFWVSVFISSAVFFFLSFYIVRFLQRHFIKLLIWWVLKKFYLSRESISYKHFIEYLCTSSRFCHVHKMNVHKARGHFDVFARFEYYSSNILPPLSMFLVPFIFFSNYLFFIGYDIAMWPFVVYASLRWVCALSVGVIFPTAFRAYFLVFHLAIFRKIFSIC